MPLDLSCSSDWPVRDEDFAAWSSPQSASTPPVGEVPAVLAWCSASALRSTPGVLPYQMPNTPSTVAPG